MKNSKYIFFIAIVSMLASPPVQARFDDASKSAEMRIQKLEDHIDTKIDNIKEKVSLVANITGKIVSVSDPNLIVSSNNQVFTVQTSSSTSLLRKYAGKSNLSEMQPGDEVHILGRFTDNTQSTITARAVRDVSIQKLHSTFAGTVKSISANTITIYTPKRGTQTITLDSKSILTNRKGQTITTTDMQIGHKISVKGLWNKTASTITEVAKLKNYSLPTKLTPTLKP